MIAYLISSKKMSLSDAFEHVRDRRPNISPNFNFMGQLLEFEKQITQTSTSVSFCLPSLLPILSNINLAVNVLRCRPSTLAKRENNSE